MKIRASMVYDGKTLSVEYDHNSASSDSNAFVAANVMETLDKAVDNYRRRVIAEKAIANETTNE